MKAFRAAEREAMMARWRFDMEKAKAKVLFSRLEPEYNSLLNTLPPNTRQAVNHQIEVFNLSFGDDQIFKKDFYQKTIDLLKDNYVRRTRLTITDDVLTRAIDATPDQAFSNAKTLISGVDKNIQAPSSAEPEFEISNGELKFPYERDIGGVKVKIGSVKVYKILKKDFVNCGG
jgi:hypothetical protein